MKNYLVLLLVASLVFTSCERETTSVESVASTTARSSDDNPDNATQRNEWGIEYLESQLLRDQIDELGIIDLDPAEFTLQVDIHKQALSVVDPVGEPLPPQGKIIGWIVLESSPGLPAGLYLLDTCTGEVTTIFGTSMGTAAGTWGNNWYNDCD